MDSKLAHWKLVVAITQPDQIPTPPRITLEDFSLTDRIALQKAYSARDWEKCESCGKSGNEYKLKKCAGCGVTPSHPSLYCSRECQRIAWPRHRLTCGEEMAKVVRNDLGPTMGIRFWRNFGLNSAKRSEGLRPLLRWAFDQVWNANPTIDLRETCLSVYCRSFWQGKGPIIPEYYQLQRIEETTWGKPGEAQYRAYPGPDHLGLVCVLVDGMAHDSEFVALSHPIEQHYIRQWPWIFATIAAMENRNEDVAIQRLTTLLEFTGALIVTGKEEMLNFEVPLELTDGTKWKFPNLDAWQAIFGHVVGF